MSLMILSCPWLPDHVHVANDSSPLCDPVTVLLFSYIDLHKTVVKPEVLKNKIQVAEDQETLQVHQKNIAHVLVI